MSGLIQGLETARRALLAHQSVLSVTGHNIANVNTPGYSRRTAQLVATPGERTPFGILGSGVRLDGVQRQRNVLLDGQIRQEASLAGKWTARAEVLGRAEGLFSEPSETGIGHYLDEFWNAWLEFSNQPEDPTLRVLVAEAGRNLAISVQTQKGRLTQLADQELAGLQVSVDGVNDQLQQLGQLNAQILRAEAGGGTDADLRDRRDVLLDELASVTGATHLTRDDGTVVVQIGSRTVVDGDRVESLRLEMARTDRGTSPGVVFARDGVAVTQLGGALGGRLEVLAETLPEVNRRFDEWARSLATEVNRIHSAGPSGVDFFSAPDAQSFDLDPSVSGDSSLINAGSSGDEGDNDIALAIAALRDARVLSGGTATLGGYYRSLVGSLGAQAYQAEQLSLGQDAVVSRLQEERSAVSGVNLDEELTRLVESQKAFEAAAQMFQTTSSLIDTLLAL